MSHDLTAKQRDSAFQHWCSLIARESRDLTALERISARALHDRDVLADGLLNNMVRAELERYRADLQDSARRELQSRTSTPPLPKLYSAPSRRDQAGLIQCRDEDLDAEFVTIPAAPEKPPPPDVDELTFRQLVGQLDTALKVGDEAAARTLFAQLGAIHQRRGEFVDATELQKYECRVAKLHSQLDVHRSRIAGLTQHAEAAARCGNVQEAIRLLRRLTAIHVAHPRLLDEVELEEMRDGVARATEGHTDDENTRKLLEREREVAAEIKRLASAVSRYHQVVFNHPEGSEVFRAAARVYLRALRETRLHEKDWWAEFVLELGDVLANWSVPPPGAAQQIDRFLERVREALLRIQANMGEIDIRRGGRNEP